MPPAEQAALPVITFDHDVSVHLNGEDVRALHYPAGHTDGDALIFFPKAFVVHMGDDYVRYGFPFIDVQAGGSVEGMIQRRRSTRIRRDAEGDDTDAFIDTLFNSLTHQQYTKYIRHN
jgi:glyoxylase-like metal-dependent hydrolase (beta-lactamase superfamily II)